MVEIGHLGGDDLGRGRAGEMQKLVEIVRADIGQDAAVFFFFKEPVRPGVESAQMRAYTESLDDISNGTSGYQLGGFRG